MGSDLDLYAMLCDVAGLQADEAALRQYAPPAEKLAADCGHTLYLAIAHRAWGILHRLDGNQAEASDRLNKALQLFQRLGARWQSGRTHLELGAVAKALGNFADAGQHTSAALALFEPMRAAPDAARARAALHSLPA